MVKMCAVVIKIMLQWIIIINLIFFVQNVLFYVFDFGVKYGLDVFLSGLVRFSRKAVLASLFQKNTFLC